MTTHTRRRFSNEEIARMLYEMSVFYEMQGVDFKPRAYERAAHGVESCADSVQDLYLEHGSKAIVHIPGVGARIAEHLAELFTTGHFVEYEDFRRATPVDVAGLTAVQGVGPQTIKTLWETLHVRNVADLEKAARAHKVSAIPHFGKLTEDKILKSIDFLRRSGKRPLLGFVAADVARLQHLLERIPGVQRVAVAGSFRRWKETIGDIDVLMLAAEPDRAIERILRLPAIGHVYGTGPTKTNLRLKSGIDVDIRIVPSRSWGAALAYFTGSEAHNIALRTIAQRHSWKLSEYGLFDGTKLLAGATEAAIYEHLGLPYIEPELREMTGELEAAKKGTLPHLIGYGDLRGDLQVQTNWTDGNATIDGMADAAEAAGLEYIAITDHTRSLAMAHGLDEHRLAEQAHEIARINRKRAAAGKTLTVLAGAEVNIREDGTLDVDDAALARLDVVGAAVHSHFGLPRREQTRRLIRAMEHPLVDVIFHPTCRIINERPELELDVDEVIAAAKRTGTVLEIDAYPDRLDLRDEYVRKCVDAGVRLAIDSDAHAPEHFALLKFGIGQARRGWATGSDVVNAAPLATLRKRLKRAARA